MLRQKEMNLQYVHCTDLNSGKRPSQFMSAAWDAPQSMVYGHCLNQMVEEQKHDDNQPQKRTRIHIHETVFDENNLLFDQQQQQQQQQFDQFGAGVDNAAHLEMMQQEDGGLQMEDGGGEDPCPLVTSRSGARANTYYGYCAPASLAWLSARSRAAGGDTGSGNSNSNNEMCD
jgi:hypothetical protein